MISNAVLQFPQLSGNSQDEQSDSVPVVEEQTISILATVGQAAYVLTSDEQATCAPASYNEQAESASASDKHVISGLVYDQADSVHVIVCLTKVLLL